MGRARTAPSSRVRVLPFYSFVMVPASAALVWLLGRWGLVADVPFPVMAGLLLAVNVIATVTSAWPAARLHAALTLQCLSGAALLYATGWGPVLGVSYVFIVQEALRSHGSGAWRPCATWAVSSLALGQLAVAAGVAPSLVDAPAVHGLAVMGAMLLAMMCRLMGTVVADQERARHEIEASRRRFESLVKNSYDAVSVLDENATVLFVSPAIERILGYSCDEVLAGDVFSFIHPDDVDPVANGLAELLSQPGPIATIEIRARHQDGTWRWLECAVSNLLSDPDVGGIVCNWRDVTERKLLADRLEFAAMHDALTELPNRVVFGDAVERAVARVRRSGGAIAVLFLDLDEFKTVNDRLGHDGGDKVLVDVAQRLQEAVRAGDLVARLGGDEFTVLLDPVGSSDDAVVVAERVLAALQPVSASIGICRRRCDQRGRRPPARGRSGHVRRQAARVVLGAVRARPGPRPCKPLALIAPP